MKRIILLIGLFLNLVVYSQTTLPQVFASGGNIQYQWTIGESIIETYVGTTYILTQGFNQGVFTYGIKPPPPNKVSINKDNEIKLFPNPVTNILNITLNSTNKWNVKVIDLNGKVLFENPNVINETHIDFSNCSPSLYIINLNDGKNISSYNIIKQ
jgi:Secretion system C-terminal sorting domain